MDLGLYGHKAKNFKLKEDDIFMRAIYIPKGRAHEYCELTLNVYNGCRYGCKYCYNPMVMRKTKEEYLKVHVRTDIANQVIKEAPKYTGKKVFLSFGSDPYPEIEKQLQITRQILQICLENKIIPVILTKSDYACRDFDILKEANGWYGTTLTFIGEEKSKLWEPRAAIPDTRIELLKLAHDSGIKTWVSLEPVINTDDTLQLIDITYGIVDEYKVGKLNYLPEAKNIDWKLFYSRVVEKLIKNKSKYYIKNDLLAYRDKRLTK